MRGPQTTIARLMGTILAVGVIIAALREATESLTFVAFLSGLIVFADATFRACLGPREGRAWWTGFALFGWVHLALGASKEVYGYLPTYYAIPERALMWMAWGRDANYSEALNRFVVANVLMSIVAAWIGGAVGMLYARRLGSPPDRGSVAEGLREEA
jgi:hypothetical protein